jgi:hypothetical protein
MFYSFVATQVTSHVTGLLYDRWTAVVVHATSYYLPHIRLGNTMSMIFRFPCVVMMVMTFEVWIPIFVGCMMAEFENCQKYAFFLHYANVTLCSVVWYVIGG